MNIIRFSSFYGFCNTCKYHQDTKDNYAKRCIGCSKSNDLYDLDHQIPSKIVFSLFSKIKWII